MAEISKNNPIPFKTQFRKLIPFISLIGFSILILAMDEYFTNIPQTQQIMWMAYNETVPFLPFYSFATFLLSFFTLVVYCWTAFRSYKPIRVIVWLFFVLGLFIEYGYFNTFNRFMTSVDFWTAALSPWSLWMEAIGMYFNKQAFIISTIFTAAVVINWRKRRSDRHPEIILILCLAGMWLMRTFLPFDQKMGISVFQYARLLEDIRPADRIFGNREPVKPITHTIPDNNIILVIDESLRGDHLSINGYARDTTPTLRKLSEAGLVTNWGIAVSGATCSIYSNPHILTGVPSTQEFDNRLTNRWPTLFQYARAMGYKTQYLDAQENYLWNGLLAKDLDFVDVHLTVDEFGRTIYADQNAASYIHDQVTQSTGNFIVLNKMGMHVLYEKNYPPEEAIWLPTPVGFDYKISSRVINAYDNALHFNLESFFQTLMPGMEVLPNTFLIYTSDHGDTLQENGETWSHCHNTYTETKVPLFFIGNLNTTPDTLYEASHSNIMATILDLMNVPPGNRLHPYASSLLNSTHLLNGQRFYLDGNLESVPYHPK